MLLLFKFGNVIRQLLFLSQGYPQIIIQHCVLVCEFSDLSWVELKSFLDVAFEFGEGDHLWTVVYDSEGGRVFAGFEFVIVVFRDSNVIYAFHPKYKPSLKKIL